jgi:hypothetical protein
MNKHPDDGSRLDERAIREHFRALREADRRQVPVFEDLLREPSTNRRPRFRYVREVSAAVAAAAIVIAVLLLRPTSTSDEDSLEEALAKARAISAWTSPTDTLLDVQAVSIASGVPSLTFTSLALPELTEPAAADAIVDSVRTATP